MIGVGGLAYYAARLLLARVVAQLNDRLQGMRKADVWLADRIGELQRRDTKPGKVVPFRVGPTKDGH